jgi:hypothetical protein
MSCLVPVRALLHALLLLQRRMSPTLAAGAARQHQTTQPCRFHKQEHKGEVGLGEALHLRAADWTSPTPPPGLPAKGRHRKRSRRMRAVRVCSRGGGAQGPCPSQQRAAVTIRYKAPQPLPSLSTPPPPRCCAPRAAAP